MRDKATDAKKPSQWGGAREGAGRPKSSALVSHLERPRLGKQRPVLIRLKIRSGFENIRNPEFFAVFEKATLRARRFGLRIIQFSFLPNKILLFCEFKNQEQLEKSFKSLNTALAVYLKKQFKEKNNKEHKGPVFLGRFEMQIIKTPDESRAALREVLTSPARYLSKNIYPDDYSSGPLWGFWKDLLDNVDMRNFENFDYSQDEIERIKHITATPQFWLSQSGWRVETKSVSKDYE